MKLFDRDRNPLYQASYPDRAYRDFSSIPPLVVDSLLFIEDHGLLDLQDPERNPAVEWGRFMLAVAGRIASVVDRRFREGGASTLATQIEKFRHSPGGRTPGIAEKFRQMVTASARAYRNGPQTAAARRDIVTTYLNSTPLGSRPGYGEIIGVPEALWVWYGTDLAEANRVLTAPATTKAQWARKGEVYRQVLGLLLANRRPAYYLNGGGAALARLDRRVSAPAGRGGDNRPGAARRRTRGQAAFPHPAAAPGTRYPSSETRRRTACGPS